MESSHWRCGSCEARFVDEHPSPRCPKCLKRSLIEPAQPAAPPVHANVAENPVPAKVEPASEPSPEERDKSAGRALVFATMPAVVAAFLVSGWFGFRLDPMIALLVAIGTAPIAGWLVAKSLTERIFASIASTIGAVGIVFATTWYIRDRPRVVNVELLLPMIVGGLPGLVVFFAFRATAKLPLLRALLAVAAVAAAVVFVTTC